MRDVIYVIAILACMLLGMYGSYKMGKSRRAVEFFDILNKACEMINHDNFRKEGFSEGYVNGYLGAIDTILNLMKK